MFGFLVKEVKGTQFAKPQNCFQEVERTLLVEKDGGCTECCPVPPQLPTPIEVESEHYYCSLPTDHEQQDFKTTKISNIFNWKINNKFSYCLLK